MLPYGYLHIFGLYVNEKKINESSIREPVTIYMILWHSKFGTLLATFQKTWMDGLYIKRNFLLENWKFYCLENNPRTEKFRYIVMKRENMYAQQGFFQSAIYTLRNDWGNQLKNG